MNIDKDFVPSKEMWTEANQKNKDAMRVSEQAPTHQMAAILLWEASIQPVPVALMRADPSGSKSLTVSRGLSN
jgi:hypothetical protein